MITALQNFATKTLIHIHSVIMLSLAFYVMSRRCFYTADTTQWNQQWQCLLVTHSQSMDVRVFSIGNQTCICLCTRSFYINKFLKCKTGDCSTGQITVFGDMFKSYIYKGRKHKVPIATKLPTE